MYRVGVIVRPKKTDALICQALAQHFDIEIAQYGVPQTHWLSWILKRLRTAGFFAMIGHIELSIYIKLRQLTERLFGKPIWEQHGVSTPTWEKLTKIICKDEQALQTQFKEMDFVIALDAFRLSQSFFRGLGVPYFEISWGDATKYLGDSAAFWEYMAGNRTTATVSVIERTSYFQKVTVVDRVPVHDITLHETIRSLKVKQAMELATKLPAILQKGFLHLAEIRQAPEQKITVQQCYAPTFFTYAMHRVFGKNALPRYACRPKEITLKIRPQKPL